MSSIIYKILLANDDNNDCNLFKLALAELPIEAKLTIVQNGDELCHHLNNTIDGKPDIIFLDLKMPLKSGLKCLDEINGDINFKNIPVIIISINKNEKSVLQVYCNNSKQFIKQPNNFEILKNAIAKALFAVTTKKLTRLTLENFIINN